MKIDLFIYFKDTFFCAAAKPDTFHDAILQHPSFLSGKFISAGIALFVYSLSLSAASFATLLSDLDLLGERDGDDPSFSSFVSCRFSDLEDAFRFDDDAVRDGGMYAKKKRSL